LSAPLLIWANTATFLAGALALVGLRFAARHITGRWVPPGVPGLAIVWLLSTAALGFAVTIEPERSLSRAAGLLLGVGVLCAVAGEWARSRPVDPFPGLLIIGAGILALATPLVVNWAVKQ